MSFSLLKSMGAHASGFGVCRVFGSFEQAKRSTVPRLVSQNILHFRFPAIYALFGLTVFEGVFEIFYCSNIYEKLLL